MRATHVERLHEEAVEELKVDFHKQSGDVKATHDAAMLDLQTQLMNSLRHNETLTEHLNEFEGQSAKWSQEKSALKDEKAELETKVIF